MNKVPYLWLLQAIAFTILKYRKLKSTNLIDQKQNFRVNGMDDSSFSLLMEAWKPISMGFKKR